MSCEVPAFATLFTVSYSFLTFAKSIKKRTYPFVDACGRVFPNVPFLLALSFAFFSAGIAVRALTLLQSFKEKE